MGSRLTKTVGRLDTRGETTILADYAQTTTTTTF